MSTWSELEVEIIVADYFNMLSAELDGEKYSKTLHRKRLMTFLSSRSEGSIEFKHQNISAILIKLGQPFIKGYLPRFNYQKILEEVVILYLQKNKSIEKQFLLFADKKTSLKEFSPNFEKLLVKPPIFESIKEPLPIYTRNPIKINYLEREQNNSVLGKNGEEFILQYEKWNLIKSGRKNLADNIKWMSNTDGDGAGFDILSKHIDGTNKYIEVKTTKLSKKTPFYFSNNELKFSQEQKEQFHLYRLFDFEENPKLFIKTGSLDRICQYEPTNYKGFF